MLALQWVDGGKRMQGVVKGTWKEVVVVGVGERERAAAAHMGELVTSG